MNRRRLVTMLGIMPVAAATVLADAANSVLIRKSCSSGKSEMLLDSIGLRVIAASGPVHVSACGRRPVVLMILADEIDPYPSEVSA